MSPDEAFRILGTRIEVLGRVVLDAWDRYRKKFAPIMGKPPRRLRATAMQALMVDELTKAFPGEVANCAGRSLLQAATGLVIQCKKLNDRGLPSNFPTRTALRFSRQLKIPGVPPGTRLTLGYVLDSLETEVAEIRLLAQHGDGAAWSREIIVNQTVMPIHGATTIVNTPAAAPKKRRLQAKGAVQSKKDRKPGA